jgi:DNA-binding PadR family transcriptional regulator
MAYPILDTLRDAGWVLYEDPSANVYTASPDGRAHVAFLSEHPAGRPAPMWEVSVDRRNDGWRQEFHAGVPCELVHAFVRALLIEHRSIHE